MDWINACMLSNQGVDSRDVRYQLHFSVAISGYHQHFMSRLLLEKYQAPYGSGFAKGFMMLSGCYTSATIDF